MSEATEQARTTGPGRGGARAGSGRPRKYLQPVNAGLFWDKRHQDLWKAAAAHLGKGKPQVLAEALEDYARKNGVPEYSQTEALCGDAPDV